MVNIKKQIITIITLLLLSLSSAHSKSLEDLIAELNINLQDAHDVCKLSDILTTTYIGPRNEASKEYDEIFSSTIKNITYICDGQKYDEKDGFIVADYDHKTKYANCPADSTDRKKIFVSFSNHPLFHNLLKDSFKDTPEDLFFRGIIKDSGMLKEITTKIVYSQIVSRGYDNMYIVPVSLLYDKNGNDVKLGGYYGVATKLRPSASNLLPYLEVKGCIAREHNPHAIYIISE